MMKKYNSVLDGASRNTELNCGDETMYKQQTLKQTTRLAVCLILLLAAGCTMDGGGVAQEDFNKTVTCKDTRDGETFSFNTNSVTNTRAGIGAPSSFDVTTDDGRQMTLNSDMEAWLKCDKSG